MSTASGEEEEMEHLEMAEVTTVEDEEKTTSDSNDAVGDRKMPEEDEEEVTVLQKEDIEEAVKCVINPTEVIVIDDDEEERIEEDAGIDEVEEEEEDPAVDYEEDDDVLMDDEVYTPLDDAGNTSSYSPEEPEAESNGQSSSGSTFELDPNFATVLRNANVARQVLNTRHPKFRHLNNMEIVHKMVAKGKVVNPADDEEEDEEGSKDDMFLNPRETKILEQTERVRVCTEMRSEDDRSGTEIIEISEGKALKSKVMILGGGIPLEPVLAQKRLNEEVEKFRYDLQKHRRCWDNVVFKHPQRKVGWKVDPSTIVPKNNDENDPAAAAGGAASAPSSAPVPRKPLFAPGEVYSTDEDWDVELGKEKELVPGTISAWTFLDDDDEDNRPSASPPPPLKSIQQQTVSGKYPQQFMQHGGTPSPQKSYSSQQQQNQGQPSGYFNQRPAASGATKKSSNRSRSSGANRSSEPKRNPKDGKVYPKPAFSYSCLIALSLKNSKTGALPVSEIYKFMCDHFPYFNTAPSGWKNSVRHNLSLNKCFEKYGEGPPGNGGSNSRKGCLWTLNPTKIHKMDEEVQKWSRKDPTSITIAMSDPENLELIERGELKRDYSGGNSDDEEEEHVDGIPVSYTLTGNMPIEFGTITSVTGNYYNDGTTADQPSTSQHQVVVTSANSEGMTYSVVNYGNEGQASNRGKGGQATTPLIIRRTVVKS